MAVTKKKKARFIKRVYPHPYSGVWSLYRGGLGHRYRQIFPKVIDDDVECTETLRFKYCGYMVYDDYAPGDKSSSSDSRWRAVPQKAVVGDAKHFAERTLSLLLEAMDRHYLPHLAGTPRKYVRRGVLVNKLLESA